MPGIGATVTVSRDGLGIPDIYADSVADLFFAQGYVHAQDRFWEMDVRRHITSGRLSEMFGESQVTTDAFLRTLGWRRIAEQEVPMLSDRSRLILDSYAERRERLPGRAIRCRAQPGVRGARPAEPGLRARALGAGRLRRLDQGAGVGPAQQHGRRDLPGGHGGCGRRRGDGEALPALPVRRAPAHRRGRRRRERRLRAGRHVEHDRGGRERVTGCSFGSCSTSSASPTSWSRGWDRPAPASGRTRG